MKFDKFHLMKMNMGQNARISKNSMTFKTKRIQSMRFQRSRQFAPTHFSIQFMTKQQNYIRQIERQHNHPQSIQQPL